MPADPARAAILVVDDDLDVLGAVARALSRAGFAAVPFDRPADALDALRRPDAYAAAIVDYDMPQMDGASFVRALRQHDRGLPVVMISGHPPEEVEMKVAGLGVFGTLAKPCRPHDLMECVRTMIATRP